MTSTLNFKPQSTVLHFQSSVLTSSTWTRGPVKFHSSRLIIPIFSPLLSSPQTHPYPNTPSDLILYLTQHQPSSSSPNQSLGDLTSNRPGLLLSLGLVDIQHKHHANMVWSWYLNTHIVDKLVRHRLSKATVTFHSSSLFLVCPRFSVKSQSLILGYCALHMAC